MITRRRLIGSSVSIALLPLLVHRAAAHQSAPSRSGLFPDSVYAGVQNEQFLVPPIDLSALAPEYRRQGVTYVSSEATGTVVVDTTQRFLFLITGPATAVRYGVGIGRQGFTWAGTARIGMKRKWPTWTPPAEMISRQPELEKYREGMAPGLENPLGARALYIFQKGNDTLYRLHGTGDVSSIGRAVSSGCVRLLNQDVIDLHERVEIGAKIVVLS